VDDLVAWLRTLLDVEAEVARCALAVPGDHLGSRGPEQVLRGIAFQRELVSAYVEFAERAADEADTYAQAWLPISGGSIRALAEEYSDRAGYREEWRP
jgi:hypothetical protein